MNREYLTRMPDDLTCANNLEEHPSISRLCINLKASSRSEQKHLERRGRACSLMEMCI